MTSAYVLQRALEYDLVTPTSVGPSTSLILSWDSGPHYNYSPPGEAVYDYQNGQGYANSTPWPAADPPPTDRIVLPDNGPYLVEAGVYCEITASGSASGTIYFEVYDRTASAVLETSTLSIFAIGTFIYGQILVSGPDPNILSGVKGHEICIRVRNQSNVSALMSPGGIYTDWFNVKELTHNADPMTTLPITTTPQTVPILVLSDPGIAALYLTSGSALITHPNSTTQTYSDTSSSSAFNVNEGDIVLMSADGRGQAVQSNGSSRDLLPNTSYKLVTAQSGLTVIQQDLGQTFNRVGKLLDLDSRDQILVPGSAAEVRGTAYQVAVDGSGNATVSVMDGSVQVGP